MYQPPAARALASLSSVLLQARRSSRCAAAAAPKLQSLPGRAPAPAHGSGQWGCAASATAAAL